jgi:hypothetical protein
LLQPSIRRSLRRGGSDPSAGAARD